MKNQNDLIAMIVMSVLTLIFVALCFMVFKRQEVAPTPPATVATAVPPVPSNPPVMAAGLPSGGGQPGRGNGLPNFSGAGPSAPSSGASSSAPAGPVGRPKNKPMPTGAGVG